MAATLSLRFRPMSTALPRFSDVPLGQHGGRGEDHGSAALAAERMGRPGQDQRRHRAPSAVTPRCRPYRPLGCLLLGVPLVAVLLAGCVPADQRPSGRVYPLPRHQPHDGLAVVTRPGGEGLHIWIETDTSRPGVCRPRWLPDAARLQGGNGPEPTSFGLAPRQEFFQAQERGIVRLALRQQVEGLCHQRAPASVFLWDPPPRTAAEYRPPVLPLLEEPELLSAPRAIRRAEKRLLGLPLTPDDLEEPQEPQPGGS